MGAAAAARPHGVVADADVLHRPEDLEGRELPGRAQRRRIARHVLAHDEVVLEHQAVDGGRLVLDEEALAAEVVDVVLAEVQVVAAPYGLEDVVVVAPLDVADELVALDQQAVGIGVGAVVVDVGLDLVLARSCPGSGCR